MVQTTLSYSAKRNPVISLIQDGQVIHKIQTIGDPHLGRVFKTGVPSERLGEREKTLFNTLHKLMNPTDPLVKDVVIPGDLFDKFIVSPTVVLTAYSIICTAIDRNPTVRYTILPGNHDLSKDVDKKSSYELLYNMLLPLALPRDNLIVLLDQPAYATINGEDGSLLVILDFVAYHPFPEQRVSFEDRSAECWSEAEHIISFGHWDSLDILDSGYTPCQDTLDNSSLVVSGHEHSYKLYKYPFDKSGSPVLFTGSMQPYSHAEDPDNLIYVTIDQDNIDQYYGSDALKFKCVRIYCDSNFALKENLTCLALSYLYKESVVDVDSDLDELSLDDSYFNKMATAISNIQSESGYENTILDLFKEKGYTNVSD